jgi:CelD/BcsL family acetyltransferase involved in cellulose biosynthesis
MASNESLKTEVYESSERVVALGAEWDALLSSFPHATVFSTLEWLLPWWRAFGRDSELRVIAFRNAQNSLVGIAPLSIISSRDFGPELPVVRLLGDGTHDSDNLDLPVQVGYEASVSQALLKWLEGAAGRWSICEFRTLPAQSPVGNRLLEDLHARRWRVFTSTRPQTVVSLPETWEAYLKGLSSKERGKIGLRTRRLEKKYAIEIYKCASDRDLDPALRALYELHGKHWQNRGLPGTLHVAARRQFYWELAGQLLARQRLDFWLLKADGKTVAAQFGLRYGTTVFSLQEGYDPDYAADSVGYVLRSHVLRTLIAEGIRKYDFLGGTDDSKLRWGGEVKQYLNLQFARGGTRGSLYLSLEHSKAKAKVWIRERLPKLVWQTLKRAGESERDD